MDRADYIHLVQKLDYIERQLAARPEHRHPVVEEKKIGILSRLHALPLPIQWVMGGAASWGISAAIGSYLLRGGDPVKLLELLFNAFI